MKLSSQGFAFGGRNRPKYMMAGGVSQMHDTTKKAANKSATDDQIDDYMQALRSAVDKKYSMLFNGEGSLP